MRGLFQRIAAAAALLGVAACTTIPPEPHPATTADAQYAALYPYYAEICALSELEKRPGFGADIFSGIGGHAVLYLNGVCRRKDTSYPVLQMCNEAASQPTADGVGLSVNAHYVNATWVGIEGRDFFFNGGLAPGQELTHDAYRAVQSQAMSKRVYDGIGFHDVVYEGMPPGFTRETFKYEMSVATDYAIAFGRNRYCARVPLSRSQMLKIVDNLNTVNAPYRAGKVFDWNVLTHNCSHINHNALAAAGLWERWKMDRFVLISAFDFPTPKNEFVNTMRRMNDMPIDNIMAMFNDRTARTLLLQEERLPTEPGALLDLGTIIPHNTIYNTDSKIIFYDDPVTGRYQQRFEKILSDPRYFRLQDNLAYFAQLYRKIERDRKPVEWHLRRHPLMSARTRNDFRLFYGRYYDYIDSQLHEVDRDIAILNASHH